MDKDSAVMRVLFSYHETRIVEKRKVLRF